MQKRFPILTLAAAAILALTTLSATYARQEALTTGNRGLPVSSNAPSFMPTHLTGPHAGKQACPLCVYGLVPQLQIWAEESHLPAALQLAKRADTALAAATTRESAKNKPSVAYLVIAPTKNGSLSTNSMSLVRKAAFKKVFLTQIPRWDDPETGGLYGHSMSDRPGLRVYALVNRRTFQRWDRPKLADWPAMAKALNKARRYVSIHEITDSQIAPAWVAGPRMEVDFKLTDPAGRPLSRVKVSAIQTDTTGLYNPKGWGRMDPTLSAVAWTNAEGRITFRTIFPGPYPTRTEPSHIHFTATIDGKPRWRTLWFEGDPLLSAEKRRWAANDEETEIVPLDKSSQPWRVQHTFVIK